MFAKIFNLIFQWVIILLDSLHWERCVVGPAGVVVVVVVLVVVVVGGGNGWN